MAKCISNSVAYSHACYRSLLGIWFNISPTLFSRMDINVWEPREAGPPHLLPLHTHTFPGHRTQAITSMPLTPGSLHIHAASHPPDPAWDGPKHTHLLLPQNRQRWGYFSVSGTPPTTSPPAQPEIQGSLLTPLLPRAPSVHSYVCWF